MLFFSSVAAATIAAIACSSSGDDNAINQSGSDGSANAVARAPLGWNKQ
jgi:hypothetical protein